MKSIKYLPLLFCLLLNSCKVYEFKYGSKDPKLKEFLPNSDMAYLVFRKGFERDSIKVFQDKNMIFNDTITNNKLNQKTIEINPNKITKIQFEGIEKLLLIKPEFLQGYKIIYIYKNKKNVFLFLHDGSMSEYHDNLFLGNKNNQKGLFRIVTIDSTNNNYFIKCQKKIFLKKELVNIIIKKQDTLIKDKEKLKIGETYKLALERYFWSDTLEIYNFSRDNDLKFYATNDLINLNYMP